MDEIISYKMCAVKVRNAKLRKCGIITAKQRNNKQIDYTASYLVN
jgi:hypothetical protein